MFEIHPSAEENFNTIASSLINKIEKASQRNKAVPRFETEIHVAAIITEENIIGEPQEMTSDYRGNTISRFFVSEGTRFGLKRW